MPPLPLIPSEEEEFQRISDRILSLDPARAPLEILEAGCGREWKVRMGARPFRLTGIDEDEAALAVRKDKQRDLDEAIAGDLLAHDFGERKFDVVFCSFVLEHVEHADRALERFDRLLKPGGLVILRIPDPHSAYGFLARTTPHWFHVFVYRHILGNREAGQPGHAPYPVYYHPVVSRKGIHGFCEANGMELIDEFADGWYRPGNGILRVMIHLFKRMLWAVSLGRLSARHTNLTYVLRKNG